MEVDSACPLLTHTNCLLYKAERVLAVQMPFEMTPHHATPQVSHSCSGLNFNSKCGADGFGFLQVHFIPGAALSILTRESASFGTVECMGTATPSGLHACRLACAHGHRGLDP